MRCPLCQEEYLLSEVLDQLPPMLVLLDAAEEIPASAYAFAGAGSGPAAEAAYDAAGGDLFERGVETAVAESEAETGIPKFPSAEESPFGGFDATRTTTAPARGKAVARPRPKRKPKNAVAEVVKVVLGGIAGLAIAQAILWWNPWARRDPFELAPKLPGFLSFLAPEDMRFPDGVPVTEDQTSNGNADAINGQQTAQAPTDAPPGGAGANLGNGPSRNSAFITPQPADDTPFDNPGAAFDDPISDPILPPTDDTGGVRLDIDLAIPPVEPPMDIPGLPIEEPALPAEEPLIPAEEPIPPVEEPAVPQPPTTTALAVKDAPQFLPEEVADAVRGVREADEQWDADSRTVAGDQLRQLAQEWYAAWCELGEHIAFADRRDSAEIEGRLEEAENLLAKLGSDATKSRLVSGAAPGWLARGDRPSQGVLLVGRVSEIRQEGDLFEARVVLRGRPDEVLLLSDRDLREELTADSEVVALGAVVTDPADRIPGYEGAATQVIWHGVAAMLPAP